MWTFYIYSLLTFSDFHIIFAGISGVHVIPGIITCTLQGRFCDTGIPRIFHGGKICIVGQVYPLKMVKVTNENHKYVVPI